MAATFPLSYWQKADDVRYTKTKARTTSQRVSTSYHPNTYASTTADNTAETGGAHF